MGLSRARIGEKTNENQSAPKLKKDSPNGSGGSIRFEVRARIEQI